MASVAAPIPAFGSHMLDQYTLAGLSAGNAHRMMMLTSFTSIAPHNAGIPNAAAVASHALCRMSENVYDVNLYTRLYYFVCIYFMY